MAVQDDRGGMYNVTVVYAESEHGCTVQYMVHPTTCTAMESEATEYYFPYCKEEGQLVSTSIVFI